MLNCIREAKPAASRGHPAANEQKTDQWSGWVGPQSLPPCTKNETSKSVTIIKEAPVGAAPASNLFTTFSQGKLCLAARVRESVARDIVG